MNPYKSLRDKMLADYKNIVNEATAIVEAAEGDKDEEGYKQLVKGMYNDFIRVSLMCRQAMQEAAYVAGETLPEFAAINTKIIDAEAADIRAGEAAVTDALLTEIAKPS